MTEFINSIDSMPEAIVASVCIIAITAFAIAFIRYVFGE